MAALPTNPPGPGRSGSDLAKAPKQLGLPPSLGESPGDGSARAALESANVAAMTAASVTNETFRFIIGLLSFAYPHTFVPAC